MCVWSCHRTPTPPCSDPRYVCPRLKQEELWAKFFEIVTKLDGAGTEHFQKSHKSTLEEFQGMLVLTGGTLVEGVHGLTGVIVFLFGLSFAPSGRLLRKKTLRTLTSRCG